LVGLTNPSPFQAGFIGISAIIPLVLLATTVLPPGGFAAPRRWQWVVIVLAVAVTALRIAALSTFPGVNSIDEPWNIAFSMSYIQDGYLSDIITLQLSGVPGHIIPKFLILPVPWIRAFGHDLWTVRLFHVLLLIPVFAFSVMAARNWYGNRTAWLTFAFMFVSMMALNNGRVRQDVGLAIAVAASLWLHTEADKRERLWLHFAAGFAMGLGALAHLHASLFGPAIALGLYLPRYVQQIRQGSYLPPLPLVLFGLGGIISGSGTIAAYILPSVDDFTAVAGNRPSSGVFAFFTYLGTHLANSVFHTPLEFVLTYAAIFAAVMRGNRTDLRLLLIFFLTHLSLGFVAYPSGHYIQPLIPIYAMLIARLFDEASREITRIDRRRVVAVASVLALMLAITTAQPLRHVLSGKPLRQPQPVGAQWIRDNIDTDARILAPAPYYIWLTDYSVTSTFLEYNVQVELGWEMTSEEVWDMADADVVVLDSTYGRPLTPPSLYETYLPANGYEQVADLSTETRIIQVYQRPPVSPG
ncbi:MAG: glycosyltransferase family 39 protein, partial [Chloroflexota bacterium]